MSSWSDFLEGHMWFESDINLHRINVEDIREYFVSQVLLVEKQIQEVQDKFSKDFKKWGIRDSTYAVQLDELRGVLKTYKELSEGLGK